LNWLKLGGGVRAFAAFESVLHRLVESDASIVTDELVVAAASIPATSVRHPQAIDRW